MRRRRRRSIFNIGGVLVLSNSPAESVAPSKVEEMLKSSLTEMALAVLGTVGASLLGRMVRGRVLLPELVAPPASVTEL